MAGTIDGQPTAYMTPLDAFDGLLDWGRLQDWIASQPLPGSGPATGVKKLAGGTQHGVFLITRGDASFVLRRPPRHPTPNSNRTLLREARVLNALADSDVPHPKLFALCDDTDVLGVVFYAMEQLDGFSPWQTLPGRYATEPTWRFAMGDECVRAAAALAAIDPFAAGLADLGKPDDWHERQVERWRSQIEGYTALPGYDGHSLPNFDEVSRWLDANLPADRRIGLIHGDFNICNAMFSLDAPRLTGLIDWELATLGDPMLDLAWILASWVEPADPKGQEPLVQPWNGFGPRARLVRAYQEMTGRDTSSISWFFALACFKLACLLEGNYARAKSGLAPDEIGRRHHARAMWLMAKARDVIHAS